MVGAEGEQSGDDRRDERLQGHIVSPAPTTERLQSIQRMVADQMGDKLPDFEADALRAIPVQAGGLYPISDVWYIEPGLDVPDRLRVHIAQFAREIAEEAAVAEQVEPSDGGIGFAYVAPPAARAMPPFARAVLTLLQALCTARAAVGPDRARLAQIIERADGLVSVRPSAVNPAWGGPGPVRNVGSNAACHARLTETRGKAAADALYLGFVQSYAIHVARLDPDMFSDGDEGLEAALRAYESETDEEFPQDPARQLAEVLRSMARAWDGPTARLLRQACPNK